MSIRQLSLKELRVVAQAQLGLSSGELKTRAQLIGALEAVERKKKVPRLIAPLAEPLAEELPTGSGLVAKEAQAEPSVAPDTKATWPNITQHFFLPQRMPRLPTTYGDDRVLAFGCEPGAIYVSWDLKDAHFDSGRVRGDVINTAGVVVRSFAVAGPAGADFVDGLPSGATVKVELRNPDGLIATSHWVETPPRVPQLSVPSSQFS